MNCKPWRRQSTGAMRCKHLAALREVIRIITVSWGQTTIWFPSEVVELTAHVASAPGFAGCTAILLLNAMRDGDGRGWINFRWEPLGAAYCALQPSRRDPILAGIRYIYETDTEFCAVSPRKARLGEGATIPVINDL